MTLKEYIEDSRKDDNLFWRLSHGETQSLLAQALDEIDSLRKQLRESEQEHQCVDCDAARWAIRHQC